MNNLNVDQKIAKAAKSSTESLYAKKEVKSKNNILPEVFPKRLISPKLFFMYVLKNLFKLFFFKFFLISQKHD